MDVLAGLSLAAALVLLAFSGSALAAPQSQTLLLASRAEFGGAAADGVQWIDGDFSGWELDSRGQARGEGYLTTEALEFALPVTEIVASWNSRTPPGSKLRVEVRAQVARDLWTPWFSLAVWPNGNGTPGVRRDASGWVNEDTLVLQEPARRVQIRLTLTASETGNSPRVGLLALVGSTSLTASSVADSPAASHPAWGKSLEVPFRSQRWEHPSISGRICGPTSLAMILEYFDRPLPTVAVAALAYDELNDIYGNWPFLAAAAAEAGLASYVTRFPDWNGVEAEILAGHPVIISIRFGPGELPGAPINSTSGHLLVVRGFTQTGDVLVNDPAAWNEETGRIAYDREALLAAWKNGVAIPVLPAVSTVTALAQEPAQ